MADTTEPVLRGALAAGAVAVLAAFSVAFGSWAAFPYDLAPGEGNELYYTVRLIAGEPLYVKDDGFPYLYNVFPPGYYLVLAPLVALLGPQLAAGRLVSLAASLAAAWLAARWARAAGAGRALQLAAAAAFLGSAQLFIWLAICRADALATLLGCGTVVLADTAARRQRPALLWAAAALGVAAAYTRQSNPLLVAAALVGVWPAFRGRAVTALAAAGAAALGLLLALDGLTNGAFWHSVSATVGWTDRAWFKLFHLRDYVLAQAGLVALTFLAAGRAKLRRSVPLGAWLGLFVGAYQALEITRVGAGTNYFLPLHFFLVTIAVRAVATSSAGARRLAGAVLAVQLGAGAAWLLPLRHAVPAGALENTARLERYLRSIPGPLLLDRQVALWLYAGRRDHFVEVAGLGLAAHHGDWHPRPLLEFIEARGYAAILLRENTLMPDPVRAAIGRAYREEARPLLWDGPYLLYRPAP